MKLTTLAAALAVTVAFAQSAHAREHSHRHGIAHRYGVHPGAERSWVAYRYQVTRNANDNSR